MTKEAVEMEAERIIELTLEIEKGFNDIKEDHGGPTSYGISEAFLRSINADLNGDGKIDRQDVKCLSRDKAIEFYRKYFYDKEHLDQITDPRVRWKLFDIGVNMGPQVSILMAQQAAGVAMDGVMGPRTAAALNQVNPDILLKRLTLAQIRRYIHLVLKDPEQEEFLDGWLSRSLNLGEALR